MRPFVYYAIVIYKNVIKQPQCVISLRPQKCSDLEYGIDDVLYMFILSMILFNLYYVYVFLHIHMDEN